MLTAIAVSLLLSGEPKKDPTPPDLIYLRPLGAPAALEGLNGVARRQGVVLTGVPSAPHFPSTSIDVYPGTPSSDVIEATRAHLTEGLSRNRGTPEALEKTRQSMIHRPVFLAGDDVGFPITPCAKGVTAFMDWEIKHIAVRWRISNEAGYSMQMMCGTGGGCGELASDRTDFHWPVRDWASRAFIEELAPGQYPFSVVGVRDGIPSAPASIFVDLCRFIEATDPPFVAGLHPNWEHVSIADQPAPRVSRGERPPEWIRLGPGARMRNPDVPPRKYPNDDNAWMKDPEVKSGFQSIEQPAGIGAIRRRVLSWEDEDAFSISILMRGGTGLPPAAGKLGAFAWVGDPAGLSDALAKGLDAFAALPDAIRLEPTGAAGETGWVEYSTAHAAPGGVLPWRPGDGELSLVVAAESLGDARIDIDWLTVRKLNCSEAVPEGYNPMGEHTIIRRWDKEKGDWIRVN